MYRDYPHRTTEQGLVVEHAVCQELRVFLRQFLDFLGVRNPLFMRIDAYVRDAALTVIEVNVELQDGWGVSLNLLRACGGVCCQVKHLPSEIIVYNDDYLAEFELAKREASMLGRNLELVSWRDRPGIPAKSAFDDKLYLTRFSRLWQGHFIQIPSMHEIADTSWENLPEDVVFKFREKYGEHARKARYSVKRRRDMGKAKFIRRCYEERSAIAQAYIETLRLQDGSAVQAVIMCHGDVPVTGYLQVASPDVFVINDKSATKGPLLLE